MGAGGERYVPLAEKSKLIIIVVILRIILFPNIIITIVIIIFKADYHLDWSSIKKDNLLESLD